MQDLFPSRAQDLNVKPKVLLARTKKSLAHHRQALEKIALPYIDVDNSVQWALDELMEHFDDFEKHVIGTAEWLNEQIGT